MILTHPDNLKMIPRAAAEPHGMPPAIPLDAIEVRTDPLMPATRKTGRLIWPRDPFVTYEESDRSWGVALGIAKEEEEPYFLDLTPYQIEVDELFCEQSKRIMQDFEQAMMQR